MKTIQLTAEGYQNLKKEHDELVNTKRPFAVDNLQKARSMGDLKENSAYSAAKEELALTEGRIREIEEILKIAQVVEINTDKNTVSLGSVVGVEIDGEKEEYQIVGEFEADFTQKKLSQTSPLGQNLMGKKVGDTIEVEVPNGKVVYKIINIK